MALGSLIQFSESVRSDGSEMIHQSQLNWILLSKTHLLCILNAGILNYVFS